MNDEQKGYLEMLLDDPTLDKADVYLSFEIRYGMCDDQFDEYFDIVSTNM
ncbi:MAG: hypothetical protein II336_05650 [Loktanella sp.]|nr:hypothetical protein [Loktanella sp.]